MRFLFHSLDQYLKWLTATASAGSATVGTESSGTYASTAADDDTSWVIDEIAATPGITLTMDFTAPVLGNKTTQLIISGYYDGNLAHTVNVDAYDWVTTSYDNLGVLPDAVGETLYTFTLDADHMDTDGSIRIRINHTSPGNATHQLFLDHVYIQKKVSR